MKLFLFLLLLSFPFLVQAHHFKIVVTVSGSNTPIDITTIEADKITHLHYNFAQINNDEVILKYSSIDSINLVQLQSLKLINPDLKLIIAIGGETGSSGFSPAAATDESRVQFSNSVIQLIKKYKLDGVELNWVMTPTGKFENKYEPADHYNYALLIEELRVALDEKSLREGKKKDDFYILSVAGSNKRQYLLYSKLKHVVDQLDYITVQSYSYKVEILNGGGVSPRAISGHHTNLYGCRNDAWPRRSADQTIKEYIMHGIPADKLVLGVACYGQGWVDVTDEANGLCQMTEGRLKEELSFHTVNTTYLNDSQYKKFWDKSAKASYLYNPHKKIFVSYESKKSIRKKARYIRNNKLGGAVMSEYQQDDESKLLSTLKGRLMTIRLPF